MESACKDEMHERRPLSSFQYNNLSPVNLGELEVKLSFSGKPVDTVQSPYYRPLPCREMQDHVYD